MLCDPDYLEATVNENKNQHHCTVCGKTGATVLARSCCDEQTVGHWVHMPCAAMSGMHFSQDDALCRTVTYEDKFRPFFPSAQQVQRKTAADAMQFAIRVGGHKPSKLPDQSDDDCLEVGAVLASPSEPTAAGNVRQCTKALLHTCSAESGDKEDMQIGSSQSSGQDTDGQEDSECTTSVISEHDHAQAGVEQDYLSDAAASSLVGIMGNGNGDTSDAEELEHTDIETPVGRGDIMHTRVGSESLQTCSAPVRAKALGRTDAAALSDLGKGADHIDRACANQVLHSAACKRDASAAADAGAKARRRMLYKTDDRLMQIRTDDLCKLTSFTMFYKTVQRDGETISEMCKMGSMSTEVSGNYLTAPAEWIVHLNKHRALLKGLDENSPLKKKTTLKVFYIYENSKKKRTLQKVAQELGVKVERLVKVHGLFDKAINADSVCTQIIVMPAKRDKSFNPSMLKAGGILTQGEEVTETVDQQLSNTAGHDADEEEEESCCICSQLHNESGNEMFMCDGGCNRGFHKLCIKSLKERERAEREDVWHCPDCRKKTSCTLDVQKNTSKALEFGKGLCCQTSGSEKKANHTSYDKKKVSHKGCTVDEDEGEHTFAKAEEGCPHVNSVLEKLGLGEYRHKLAQDGFDIEVMVAQENKEAVEDTLQSLNIKTGFRLKLIMELKKLWAKLQSDKAGGQEAPATSQASMGANAVYAAQEALQVGHMPRVGAKLEQLLHVPDAVVSQGKPNNASAEVCKEDRNHVFSETSVACSSKVKLKVETDTARLQGHCPTDNKISNAASQKKEWPAKTLPPQKGEVIDLDAIDCNEPPKKQAKRHEKIEKPEFEDLRFVPNCTKNLPQRPLRIGGQHVRIYLHKLFYEVYQRGGFRCCTETKLWSDIARKMVPGGQSISYYAEFLREWYSECFVHKDNSEVHQPNLRPRKKLRYLREGKGDKGTSKLRYLCDESDGKEENEVGAAPPAKRRHICSQAASATLYTQPGSAPTQGEVVSSSSSSSVLQQKERWSHVGANNSLGQSDGLKHQQHSKGMDLKDERLEQVLARKSRFDYGQGAVPLVTSRLQPQAPLDGRPAVESRLADTQNLNQPETAHTVNPVTEPARASQLTCASPHAQYIALNARSSSTLVTAGDNNGVVAVLKQAGCFLCHIKVQRSLGGCLLALEGQKAFEPARTWAWRGATHLTSANMAAVLAHQAESLPIVDIERIFPTQDLKKQVMHPYSAIKYPSSLCGLQLT
jgi:hypothetical protein